MRQHLRIWQTGLVLVGIIGALLWLALGTTKQAEAAGTASFGISPTTGTYTVGNTVGVAISMTASPSDNANAVQVNLTFPTSLTWQSTSLTGPFTLCAQNSHTATTVSLACAASSAQSGTQAVATINFTVASAGSAIVALAGGSDIANTSGSSVFNGSLPSANYTLSSGSSTPPPSSGGGSSTPPPSNTTTTPKTSTPKTNTPPSTTPPASQPPTADTPTSQKETTNKGSLSVTVKDSAGKRIEGALVKMEEREAQTNANGVANFSGVSSGKYTLYITAAGKEPLQTTVTISSGENKLATQTLTDAKSSGISWVWFTVASGVLVLTVAGGTLYLRARRRPKIPTPTPPSYY